MNTGKLGNTTVHGNKAKAKQLKDNCLARCCVVYR
jgi:hypothetical protein